MRVIYSSILFSMFGISACAPNIDKNDYFPLEEGIKWHYVVSEQYTEQLEPYDFYIENLGQTEKTLIDKYFEMPVYVRQDAHGTKYYLLKAPDGIFRIAQQYIIDRDLRYDERERMVLPAFDTFASPDTFTSADTWYAQSRTYALRGAAVDTVPDAEDLYFDMEYEIVESGISVEVPAGRFDDSIKVVGRGSFSLYADPKLGYIDIDIKQTEWYAPGVGLVKLIREEPKEAGLFYGGTIVYELNAFIP